MSSKMTNEKACLKIYDIKQKPISVKKYHYLVINMSLSINVKY
jgi:hypothetical protein